MDIVKSISAACVGLAISVSSAHAQQNVNCTGTLAAGTYDNVIVPKNASCTLNSSVAIQGNVMVAAGGSLTTAFAVINGNVLSHDAAVISLGLAGTTEIGMNVTLLGTTGEALILNNNIGGNVQITGSTTGSAVEINDNNVTGNVIVLSNNSPRDIFSTMRSAAIWSVLETRHLRPAATLL